jgi:hypothetical protein
MFFVIDINTHIDLRPLIPGLEKKDASVSARTLAVSV